VFDLNALPSHDHRFETAGGDIYQHRILNDDWPEDWVWSDSRLNLLRGPDEVFLRFLCEALHPAVRHDPDEASSLADQINGVLRRAGWEVVPTTYISGRPIYTARRANMGAVLVDQARALSTDLGEYVSRQVTRMEAAIESDPELAIGTAKEFLETICKTILRQRSIPFADTGEDVTALVKLTARNLQLLPADVERRTEAAASIRVLLSNLGAVAQRLAEIRNLSGTGHGRTAQFQGLQPRHARLAVHAAVTLGVFLYEAHAATPSARGDSLTASDPARDS
jgi:AbiJ N-terminal domain 3/Abortive infection C-terminus